MLDERQRRFVELVVATGGQNYTDCVVKAGYSENRGSAHVQASRMMRNPEILRAIREECAQMDEGGIPIARALLWNILTNPQHDKHFEALKWYFGTVGISPITKTESKKTVEHTTRLGALEELKMLAAQLKGLPAPKIVDVTPEEEEWSAHG